MHDHDDVGFTSRTVRTSAFNKLAKLELVMRPASHSILVFDGWDWQMGHKAVAYQEIRLAVRQSFSNSLV
jgi:hypothetical protein